MTVTDIIERFDGTSAFALAVGVPVSTAHSWKRKNYIPEWRHRDILEAAFERKLDISVADIPTKVAA